MALLINIDNRINGPYIFADSVEVLTSEPDFEYEPAVEHEIETEEATREVEEEEDDTLIPDTNNLHHQTESTGTLHINFVDIS